jgi:UDP-3-O-[3-hydroxymyristoyl] glucosamine N-acyltransferase
MVGGQVGLAGHLTVGDKTFIGAQSGVMSDIKGNEKLFGTPCMEPRAYFKSYAYFRRLPEIYKELENLKKELEELKTKNS